ncbi:MAG TPA: VOC family protein [Candidatus Limnocylindrales bacterium]|jgi:catechol 2,3-dioxygenase-like lactoylglutathione lyase family enzyme|nr:VOC family protein [Candidatus Limnocylindrales bacterium]
MLLGIDHVVLACADPDATAAVLESRLGLAASAGGRHDALGTENRLIWLGDAYLELVGVFDPALAAQSWLGRPVLAALEGGADGGLVTWAIAVDDLDDTLRWAPPEGGLLGPLHGERRRPDGRLVRWRLARPDAPSPTEPFLIEHDREAAEWSLDDRAARAEQRHPLGGRARLVSLEVETASPAIAAGRLRSLLAARAEPAGRAAVRVRLADHEVRFVTSRPGSDAVVDVVVDVPLRTRVAAIGDCSIRVRGLAEPVNVRRPLEDPADV